MILPYPEITVVALNILIVASFFYFIQGLAIVVSFFNRFSFPFFMRLIFWVVLIIQPYLIIGIAILGIFDTWGNFRVPKIKNL